MQVRPGEWQVRRAAALKLGVSHVSVHEQFASEASSNAVVGDLSRSKPSAPMPSRSPSSSPNVSERAGSYRKSVGQVSSHVSQSARPKRTALRWAFLLWFLAVAGIALRNATVQQCQEVGGAVAASRKHGENRALPRRHFHQAVFMNKFEDLALLKDCGYLRDRLGIKLAFLQGSWAFSE